MHSKIMDGRALVVRLRSEGGRLGGGGGGERPSRGFAPGENDESKARPARCRVEPCRAGRRAGSVKASSLQQRGAPPRAAGRPPGTPLVPAACAVSIPCMMAAPRAAGPRSRRACVRRLHGARC
jgi:hypothetical protein